MFHLVVAVAVRPVEAPGRATREQGTAGRQGNGKGRGNTVCQTTPSRGADTVVVQQ